MARYAVIEGGIVTNIVEAEADFAADQGWIASDDAKIDDTYADGQFSTPPYVAPVPVAVTPMKAKLALLQAGLLDTVEAAIAAADRPTQIAWANATEFVRTDPFVVAIGTGLGLTTEQMDALFVSAGSL